MQSSGQPNSIGIFNQNSINVNKNTRFKRSRKVFLKKDYFFGDVNLERIEDNILFIGFTSGFNSIKES